MKRKLSQKQMLEKMYADLHYIRYEMKVNGSLGLENSLRSHDTQIKQNTADTVAIKTAVESVRTQVVKLEERGEVLWRAAEGIRAKADFWKAWKQLSATSPVLSFISRFLMHKVVIYFLVGFFIFSFLLALGFSVTDALGRVTQLLSKIKIGV